MIVALLVVLIVVVWVKADDATSPHYYEYNERIKRYERRRL